MGDMPEIIGYRNGRPVFAIAGGSEDGGEGGEGTEGAEGAEGGESTEQEEIDWKAEAEKWKAQARKHEGRAKANADAAKRIQEIENANKSDAEKLTAAETRATEAESRALRLEVAFDKGLSPAQAKRLVGSTREELEADADELLATFKPAGKDGASDTETSGTRRPREALRSGAAPGAEPEVGLDKVVESIPRDRF